MRLRLTRFFILLLLSLATLLFPALLPAQVHDRIAQPLQVSESQPVRGNVHPFARTENDQGEAAGSMMLNRMVMTFSPSAAQQADLAALLSEQQNPLSPYYHQWLTPEQFADRFGLTASDIAKVVDWLQGQGFSVDETARSRSYVAFSGTAAQVEASFGTPIHHYMVNGEFHYANVSDPKLPWPLANVVIGIRGLNDFRPKPRGGVGRTSPRPQFTSSISGSHYLAPDDFATIYNLKPLYNSGIDGTGQRIAVMGQTDLILSDISTFRSVSGLPASAPIVVLVPGSADPGVVNGDIGEADLDIEWSGAVAPKATIVYVNSTNAFNSMGYAISQNLAPVISISYGDCEPNFSTSDINTLVAWGQQANTQGQTIVGPSGDSGAADCDYPLTANSVVTSAIFGLQVDVPAALPYVTGAGGTTFNDGSGTFWSSTNNANNGSALSYIPETAWNDTAFEIANGGSLAATGGGVSKLFPKPSWQTGAGVPNDGQRDVPDISFSGSPDHDGYLVCSQGSCVNGFRMANNNLFVVGGTSAGVPTFAGIVALINQKLSAAQGNVNPRLYQLAGTSTDAFHDITTGDNKVPCTPGTTNCPAGTTSIGFSAGVGYDPVTGLGSVNAFNLVMEWNGSTPPAQPDFTVAAVTATATVAQGTTAQYSITLTPANGLVGGISLAVTGLPAGATPTFNPNPVSITGAAAQSSVLQVTTTSSTAVGTYSLTVTAVGGGLTHTAALSLTVTAPPTPDFQAGVSPSSLTLTAGTTANVGTSTLTISALNGFTGTVSLTCTVASLPGTTCSVLPASLTNSGTATVTVTAPTTRTVDLRPPKLFPHFFPWTDGTFAIAMGLMLAGKRERTSKKTKMAILAVMLILAIAIMIGCGGGGSSTTSSSSGGTPVTGTGTVTVTAISGSLSHSATITVTVN
jgi:subtilase family serine protease